VNHVPVASNANGCRNMAHPAGSLYAGPRLRPTRSCASLKINAFLHLVNNSYGCNTQIKLTRVWMGGHNTDYWASSTLCHTEKAKWNDGHLAKVQMGKQPLNCSNPDM
jgi:hypothetical protein